MSAPETVRRVGSSGTRSVHLGPLEAAFLDFVLKLFTLLALEVRVDRRQRFGESI